MECEFLESHNTQRIQLNAETEAEQEFLDKAFKEGLRNYTGGSANCLALPSTANLRQIHLKEELAQQIINCYPEPLKELAEKEFDSVVVAALKIYLALGSAMRTLFGLG